MRSHISVHRATTKYFSNSFVLKTEIEKEGLPGDITPDLGAGGRRFKSLIRVATVSARSGSVTLNAHVFIDMVSLGRRVGFPYF
jgi:hypothetical protein